MTSIRSRAALGALLVVTSWGVASEECVVASAELAVTSAEAVAAAEEERGPLAKGNFSSTLTITTDYIFRGLSFSGEEPALQGSFDWGYNNFYVGVWGSSIKGEDGFAEEAGGYELELDYYGGYASSLGPIDYDLMLIYFHFPGAEDAFDAETDQFETWLTLGHTFSDVIFEPNVSVLGAWSPAFTLEDGTGIYVKGSVGFTLPAGFGFDGAFGYQRVEGDKTTPDGYHYTHWEMGVTKSLLGFDLDLRYHDTDEDDSLVAFFGGTTDPINNRFVFTVSRTF